MKKNVIIFIICFLILTTFIVTEKAWCEYIFNEKLETNSIIQPIEKDQPSPTIEVNIGTDNTFDYNFPYFYWWRNGLSEIIFMSEEISEQGVSSGLLTELILYYTNNSTLPDQSVSIWVGETAYSSPPEEWLSAEELTLVYEGLLNIPDYEGELHLPLTEPYSYTGENLVIMIHRPWHNNWGGNLCFYYSNTPDFPDRAIYNYSDTEVLDPLNPPLDSFYLSCVPNTTLIFTINVNGSIDDYLKSNIVHLISNFPNPFNPSTTIEFSIQKDSEVELSVYNIKGQKIKTLADKEFIKGSHSVIWNGNDESENPVSSGMYFYKLYINGKSETVNKCLLLK